MPLEELGEQLTAEERDEISEMFRFVNTREPGKQLFVKEEMVELLQRHYTAAALSSYAFRMRVLARGKLARNEPDAQDYVDRALQAALKARAADSSSPSHLIGLAESLQLACRPDDAEKAYLEFVREQSQYPDDSAGPELIELIRERLKGFDKGPGQD